LIKSVHVSVIQLSLQTALHATMYCRLLSACLSTLSSWMMPSGHFSGFCRTAILHLSVKITLK